MLLNDMHVATFAKYKNRDYEGDNLIYDYSREITRIFKLSFTYADAFNPFQSNGVIEVLCEDREERKKNTSRCNYMLISHRMMNLFLTDHHFIIGKQASKR